MAAKPTPLDTVLGFFNLNTTKKPDPKETIGAPGTAIFGGYIAENEKEAALSSRERYLTFSQALANTSIVSAGVRYFQNLAAKAEWTIEPADHPEGERLAEEVEKILKEDPRTSWARIVRRAAMYRFYGFSIQEWTARVRDDGVITFQDIAPRAQITIEKWNVATDGQLLGVVQRNPQNQQEIYLPREKLVYLVDDSLNDSPQGLGLFRHIAEPVARLNRYEQLEGWGFETDLRGVPVGRAPYAEIQQAIKNGDLTDAEASALLAPIQNFVNKHVRRADIGVMLDSMTYQTTDERSSPSNVDKFGIDIINGGQTALPDMAKAIERVNREIARVLGVESILLGDGDRGSHALSTDKTNQFGLTVDATLDEMADTFESDLLVPLWQLNGWPAEAMPQLKTEAVKQKDISEMTAALRNMAAAGAMLSPDDEAINDIRSLMGLSLVDLDKAAENAALTMKIPGLDDDDDEDDKSSSDKEEEGATNDDEELPEKPENQENDA